MSGFHIVSVPDRELVDLIALDKLFQLVELRSSERNKNNREKQVTKYTCGPLSFEEINFATDKFKPYDATNEEKFKETITMNLQNAFRNWKSNLHKHYNNYASDEDRRANPPPNISSEDWELLLAYFQTDVFTKKSKRNKTNREKQVTKHTCGCLSFEEIKFATVLIVV
ncbi:hypothetical protein K1719_026643 [Acacia pycnantha]|nr:hypothetical protein K1719_026643 [Acacia pycnantha]